MRKTSKIIRREINRAWRVYGHFVRGGYPHSAAENLESIRLMEREYEAAVAREKEEAR